MKSKAQKILQWIKCHIFNRHVYIKNNYGLEEESENSGLEGYTINWDNDSLGDICSYYDCQNCDSFHVSSYNPISKETLQRILHLKKVYKISLEKRVVLIEKFADDERYCQKVR